MFGSRSTSQIVPQAQLHHMRHIVRELVDMLSEERRNTPKVQELAGWGCATTMHLVEINLSTRRTRTRLPQPRPCDEATIQSIPSARNYTASAGSPCRKIISFFRYLEMVRPPQRVRAPMIIPMLTQKQKFRALMGIEEAPVSVCRQNISDIWFGNKRVSGSSGLEVQAAIAR